MVDKVTYSMHLSNLNKIRDRTSHYPSYIYPKKLSCFQKSGRQLQIEKIRNEIKENKNQIKEIKQKISPEKRPPNYDDDEFLFKREVDNIQKLIVGSLVNQNKKLKSKLNNIKNEKYAPKGVKVIKRSNSVVHVGQY